MNDHLPVCNYEGSDYQTSFWDQGGRAYEDGAEEVALRRLLPPEGGRCLLEVGAGAGRNTPRYRNFSRVVLMDYSFTQLQQARQRLGDASADGKTSYTYVAADVYHLPFVPRYFDAATMIRVLHHLVEPRAALEQIHETLTDKAVFILEFANKQNIKSILRYALRQQSWNPFSPEPVEFAALNFDFHPATVRTWLQLSQFVIERQLTVSHFRIALMKRFLPTRLLVGMDSMAQLTGDLWQFSPSVFVRTRAKNPVEIGPLAWEQGQFLRCPACNHAPLPDTPPLLTCLACGKTYPVVDGIYDLRASIPE